MQGAIRSRDLVLVIDDDAAQRELLGRFLSREGFSPCMAADGQRGLELARTLRPKVILLDVMMPGIDGWSVLGALKDDPVLARIPVVMITFSGDRGLASSLGAAEYVAKPVDWTRFKAVMAAFRSYEGPVLVVDDDPDARHHIRHALERDRWTVIEAENGADALARLDAIAPAVVLLDLQMPVMDGFTFLAEFRGRPGCRDVPVVVLTASDVTQEDRSRLAGADQVLRKGVTDLGTLAQELHDAADRKGAPGPET